MVQTRSSILPAVPSFPESLTASSAVLPIGSGLDAALEGPMFGAYQGGGEWQREAYRHMAICSEARQSVVLLARAVGRAKLVGSSPAAAAALKAIFSGPLTERDYLERSAAHLTVGGEYYFIGRRATAAETLAYPGMEGQPIWEVRQPSELSNEGNVVRLNAGLPSPIVLDTANGAHVSRVWEPDLLDQNQPDSPLRALLPVLAEIEAGTNRIWAQMTSRLTGNGILSVPESWEVPALPGQPADPMRRRNSLSRTIAAVASMAMQDPKSPAARLPITVIKPDGTTDNIEWHTFWSELDAATVENRKEAILRYAIGMDMPAEMILGLSGQSQTSGSGTNRWGIWAVEEQTITNHVEPLLFRAVSPVTRLVRLITGDPEDYVEFDTTDLRLKPDRSKESLELYDRGLVGAEVVLKANGFDPKDDKMKPAEVEEFIARRIAIGGAPIPEQLAAAAAKFGVIVPSGAVEGGEADRPQRQLGQNPATQQADERTQRALDHHGQNPRANLTASTAVGIDPAFVVSCEAVVLRLLERVGSKLIRENSTKSHPVTGIDPTQAHLSLTAAGVDWTAMLAGPNAFGTALLASASCPDDTLDHLTEFAESLVHARKPYTREALVKALTDGELHG